MARVFQAHHLQPRTTAETQSKSNHNTTTAKTQPKSNCNKNPKAHQITNQITPTEIKIQNPQNNQNHKMKILKVNPLLEKTYIGFVIIF